MSQDLESYQNMLDSGSLGDSQQAIVDAMKRVDSVVFINSELNLRYDDGSAHLMVPMIAKERIKDQLVEFLRTTNAIPSIAANKQQVLSEGLKAFGVYLDIIQSNMYSPLRSPGEPYKLESLNSRLQEQFSAIHARAQSPVAQVKVNMLMEILPDVVKQGDGAMVEWVDEFAKVTENEYVKFNASDVANTLKAAGYEAGAFIGDPAVSTDPKVYAGAVIGKVIGDLESHGRMQHSLASSYQTYYGMVHAQLGQARVDELMQTLPDAIKKGNAAVVDWLDQYTSRQDPAQYDYRKKVAETLKAAGYEPEIMLGGGHFNVPAISTNPDFYAKNVINQAVYDIGQYGLNRDNSEQISKYHRLEWNQQELADGMIAYNDKPEMPSKGLKNYYRGSVVENGVERHLVDTNELTALFDDHASDVQLGRKTAQTHAYVAKPGEIIVTQHVSGEENRYTAKGGEVVFNNGGGDVFVPRDQSGVANGADILRDKYDMIGGSLETGDAQFIPKGKASPILPAVNDHPIRILNPWGPGSTQDLPPGSTLKLDGEKVTGIEGAAFTKTWGLTDAQGVPLPHEVKTSAVISSEPETPVTTAGSKTAQASGHVAGALGVIAAAGQAAQKFQKGDVVGGVKDAAGAVVNGGASVLQQTGSLAEAGSAFRGVAKVAGPVAVGAPIVFGAAGEGYEAYKEGKGLGGIAAAAAGGAGVGAVDAYLPGARDGYSDVIGNKHLTWADRMLNTADHASATATAVGGTAMIVEAVGVVSLPAEIPTAIATGVAGVSNVAVNVAKAGLKVTGLAGADQDGGYVYNGIATAKHAASVVTSAAGSYVADVAISVVDATSKEATAWKDWAVGNDSSVQDILAANKNITKEQLTKIDPSGKVTAQEARDYLLAHGATPNKVNQMEAADLGVQLASMLSAKHLAEVKAAGGTMTASGAQGGGSETTAQTITATNQAGERGAAARSS